MTSFLFNASGLLLILFIVWWFILKKPKAKKVQNDTVDVLVKDGVYEPSIIRAEVGKTLRIRFMRKDATPCAEYVSFNDFNVSAKLPLDEYHTIELELKQAGEYEFTCQMGMYRGKLIVA